MTFPVEDFLPDGRFAALAAGVFFPDGRFLLGAFFFEELDFFADAFLLLTLDLATFFLPLTFFFAVFLVDGGRFLLLVFFVDFPRRGAAAAVFFTDGFLPDDFFTVVFLLLVRFLAAAFLPGISIASKADSENRRLYIRCRIAEESRGPGATKNASVRAPMAPSRACDVRRRQSYKGRHGR